MQLHYRWCRASINNYDYLTKLLGVRSNPRLINNHDIYLNSRMMLCIDLYGSLHSAQPGSSFAREIKQNGRYIKLPTLAL